MKFRKTFVTNSSSCSFLIENKSDEHKTLTDFAHELINNLSEDAIRYYEDYYEGGIEEFKKKVIYFSPGSVHLSPHSSVEIECGDSVCDDGAFEAIVHYECIYGNNNLNNFAVKMLENHH